MMQSTKKYKGPVYKFSKEKLIENYNLINSTFKSAYERFKIGYSFKTNSYSKICKTMKNCGAYAEVVSSYEFKKARKIGYKYKDIIYNGVCKDIKQVKKCLSHRGKVNADNIDEVELFKKNGINEFGLRVSFDVGNNVVSRFGVEINSDEYLQILDMHKKGTIKIIGLHCHLTEARNLKAWQIRAEEMVCCANDFGMSNIQYLDFGGNMYSEMPKEMNSLYKDKIPSFSDYSRVLSSIIKATWEGELPEVIIETGTPMVANVFSVLSKVLWIKKNKEKTFAILDCSQFDLGAVSYVDNCPCKKISSAENCRKKEKYILTGYTCMEDDVLKKEFVSSLKSGDVLEFGNCGAYSYAWANDFIKEKLKVVEV